MIDGYYDKDGKFVKFIPSEIIVGVIKNGEVIGDFTETQKKYFSQFKEGYIVLERGQLVVKKEINLKSKTSTIPKL